MFSFPPHRSNTTVQLSVICRLCLCTEKIFLLLYNSERNLIWAILVVLNQNYKKSKNTVKTQLYLLAMWGWIPQQFKTTCFGLYRPSSGCTTSCYKVKLYNMQDACYWWRDVIHMNYILSYNYCNLDRVEYSGTDTPSVCDGVQSEAGITQVVK